jgi:hypothetical protein
MRYEWILATLLLCGCAAKKPVQPAFAERHCPNGAVRHVARYENRLIEICEDRNTKGIFQMGAGCNPYADTDCDDSLKDKSHKRKVWWKFWMHVEHEKDSD